LGFIFVDLVDRYSLEDLESTIVNDDSDEEERILSGSNPRVYESSRIRGSTLSSNSQYVHDVNVTR
jgi:hypothetical protein